MNLSIQGRKAYTQRILMWASVLYRFFPLLLMYFIIGILVNRYGRGIESMPELIPNYSFWADVPFLVKVSTSVKT